MTFVARGQPGCSANISDAFKANALSYTQKILANSDFGGTYIIETQNPSDLECRCYVSAANWGIPMYMCYFRITLSNPDQVGGAPQTVAQSMANDVINPVGPSMCTDNPAQPFCFGDLGVTEACAKHPAQYEYYCTVARPPNPIKTPLVWVQEAERCDANVTLNGAQAQALLDLVRPQAPGLVVTLADFNCQNLQGDAFYQAVFQIAAGASLSIFSGSSKIVDLLNSKAAMCTAADAAARPLFCQAPPLGGSPVCSIDQYDPVNVYVCPRSPGNMAMSFAVPDCDCATTPRNTATDTTNILEWVNTITTTNKIAVTNTVPEYKCTQAGTTCQYQYRIRSAPRDVNTDGSVAIQFLIAEINANKQPCSDVSGFSFAFCVDGAYWSKATGCAGDWDRTNPLTCAAE